MTLDGAVVDTGSIFHRLLLFHKPANTVCCHTHAPKPSGSPARRPRSIFSVLPASQRHPSLTFFGRLDRDTTGLMLLGSDGGIGHLLTSPDTEVSTGGWLAGHR